MLAASKVERNQVNKQKCTNEIGLWVARSGEFVVPTSLNAQHAQARRSRPESVESKKRQVSDH